MAAVLSAPASVCAASKTGKKYVTYKKITKNIKKGGITILKGTAKYPKLKSKSKSSKKINSYFKKTVNKIVKNITKAAKNDYASNGTETFDRTKSWYTFDVDIKLTYNAKGKYSFKMVDYEYWMGAHGYTAITGHNFSKSTGKRVSNSKLTKYSGDELKEKIVSALEKEINKEPRKYNLNALDSVKQLDVNKFNIWLKGKKIHVIFNQYDIASYAAGMTELTIKF